MLSLRGRAFFDAVKHQWMKSTRFSLPVPPYYSPDYWDRCYKDMDPHDVHEWGGLDFDNLVEFRYETILHLGEDASNNEVLEEGVDGGGLHTSTFAECMDVSQWSTPDEALEKYQEMQAIDGNNNESILLLGCGNSKVGEQILTHSFTGPILQVDISSKVIQLMTDRYAKYLEDERSIKRMDFIVDDAQGLTALSPESIGGGVFDKGLIDALHCSGDVMSMDDSGNNKFTRGGRIPKGGDGSSDIQQVVNSVHKSLQPSRPFIFFSRSGYDYILRRTLGSVHWNKQISKQWKDIQVLKLVDYEIMMYRFVKADKHQRGSRRSNNKRRTQ